MGRITKAKDNHGMEYPAEGGSMNQKKGCQGDGVRKGDSCPRIGARRDSNNTEDSTAIRKHMCCDGIGSCMVGIHATGLSITRLSVCSSRY